MKNIWDRDEENKPVTILEVKAAESELGISLPASYIELCKFQNGDYLIYDAFPTTEPNTWADDHVSASSLYGIKKDGILDTAYLLNEWGLPKNLVLIAGDGHSWIALDYRHQKEDPPVIYLEEGDEMEWKEIPLAASFEEYINKLYNHEDDDE
ncbi:SMI1/KNR4 family protein [Priestia megaterium]|nr:SMI1/KNR4 family protein [Priestia megaterium]